MHYIGLKIGRAYLKITSSIYKVNSIIRDTPRYRVILRSTYISNYILSNNRLNCYLVADV